MEAGEQIMIAGRVRTEESGFALPSVIMLITLLSLVSFSIITLQYLNKRLVQMQIATVKAEYAAQSGVVKILASPAPSGEYTFSDGSEASVRSSRWGMFILAVSEGKFRNLQSTRIALAGARLSGVYRNALVFGNNSHQLVFTGTAAVKGDVIVGQPGIATGTMKDFITPIKIPVDGNVTKETTPALPGSLERSGELLSSFYGGRFGPPQIGAGVSQPLTVRLSPDETGRIDLSTVSDSIDYVTLAGNVVIDGRLKRRLRPLSIIIEGNATFRYGSLFEGLIAINAAGGISVPKGAGLRNCLVVSRTSIHIMDSASVSGQFISPDIVLDSNSVLRYPSLVMSVPPPDSLKKGREVTLGGNARVEGWVILCPQPNGSGGEDVVTVSSGASVTGLIRSENLLSLDGYVAGIVHTKDFYFYQSPTKYYGWMKSGRINRTALPDGFLLPPVLTDTPQYEVLEWL